MTITKHTTFTLELHEHDFGAIIHALLLTRPDHEGSHYYPTWCRLIAAMREARGDDGA